MSISRSRFDTIDRRLGLDVNLRTLIAELDTPSDPDVEKAWLQVAQRRYRELIDGRVNSVPGRLVFERLRSQLRG